ncbi:DUF7698 family protein [Arcanobacterium haemolyticum]|uniref:DUF7698 domain-containing protein n=1 Tax=Arcanobacterium haemolyticum (strain ATCC 9345 / DSM 20595 / CCM 5947 / CCUG 17215 / LMG 16163 / NBRC 15585 / NCTC 8452 / 11018) TaxID=644284 RepID=D7BKS5_ARCHD|nr:hypothetical protein [Arcanobacterium haemolyticum]ADH93255.1 hypothetical protein Arch_1564 [Arcanobacterium haemolyticum DSM 20595]SQH27947.1 Uncharacterised protein [Arcanobacterium haemolyticum]
MNTIEALETQVACRTQTSHRAVLTAYMDTQKADNELLDFFGVIFDADIPAIITELKELGIGEFTISVGQTDMATLLWSFAEHGAAVNGLVKVKSAYVDWTTGEHPMVPAFHLTIT